MAFWIDKAQPNNAMTVRVMICHGFNNLTEDSLLFLQNQLNMSTLNNVTNKNAQTSGFLNKGKKTHSTQTQSSSIYRKYSDNICKPVTSVTLVCINLILSTQISV